MLDTGWRQLRYGIAMAMGRELSVPNVRRLVDDLLATRAEFGGLGREEMQDMLGTPLDPEARRMMDARRWRNAVRQAYEGTTYYRDTMDGLGLAPDQLTLDRSGELPPTPKEALRSRPEAFVNVRGKPVLQAWTTGTTGAPTSIWFSRYELELAASLSAVSFIMSMGLAEEDVLQICMSSRAVLGLHNTMEAWRMIGAACFLTGIIDPAETLARLAAPVHLPGKKARVSAISISPSYLAMLVHAAPRLGYSKDDFGLERILCVGEILTDALRMRAEATFGGTVTDNYGMTETFPVAGITCREGPLHVSGEQGLVEILEPGTYTPTQPGHVGMLVITPFPPYRQTTPVLRLATGDMVRRLRDDPTCELAALPASSPLLGKAALCPRLGERPLYQRHILELLEAEPGLPLPCRYAVNPAGEGFELHVLADGPNAGLERRLQERGRTMDLPIVAVTLHGNLASMPGPQFARALLRETVVIRDERSESWTLR